MTIITNSIKKLILSSAIVSSSLTSFAQQNLAENCDSCIVLPTPSQTCSQYSSVMEKHTKWFKINTDSKSLEVDITQTGSQSAEITKVSMLDGSCENVLPIKETTVIDTDGSVNLKVDHLIKGQTCFIKLEREKINPGNFTMCVKEVAEPSPPVLTPTNSVVSLKPILGQGFLVLNKQGLDIDKWLITIVKKTFSVDTLAPIETDRIKTAIEVMQRITLPNGTNYLYIPNKYLDQSFEVNYLVNIMGLNSTKEPIIIENDVQLNDDNGGSDIIQANGIGYYENCSINCLSNSYAYRIQQYKYPNANLSHFKVLDVLPSVIANPSETQSPFY